MSLVAGRGPLSADPAGRFAPPIPGDRRLHRAASAPRPGRAGRPCGDRHRARADGASPGTPAQLPLPRRRGGRSTRRARAGSAGLRPRPVGRRRHLARGRPRARSLPAESVSPGRLPPDQAPPAGRSRTPRWWTPTTQSSCSRPHSMPGSTSTRRWCAPICCSARRRRVTATTRVCDSTGRWPSGRSVIDDVAWSYEDPPPESLPIKGFLEFRRYSGRRGRAAAKPVTPRKCNWQRNSPSNTVGNYSLATRSYWPKLGLIGG